MWGRDLNEVREFLWVRGGRVFKVEEVVGVEVLLWVLFDGLKDLG